MKKVILLGSILVSMLLADGVGVREAMKQANYRIGPMGDTKTQMEYERLATPGQGIHVLKICKLMGGDNIFSIKGKDEIPFLLKDGSTNPEAGVGLKGLFSENVFGPDKKYPIVCKKDKDELFKVTDRAFSEYKDNIGLVWYRGYMLFEHSPEKMPLRSEATGGINPNNADANDVGTIVAKKTAQFKSNYNKIDGNIQYLGTYNGIDSSKCDLVSVIKKTDGSKNLITNNYKVCKNKIVNLGVSEPTNINNKELDTAIKTTAKICQQSGSAVTEVDKFTLSCRALRDKDVCTVEVSVLNSSNQLVDKKILNGCN